VRIDHIGYAVKDIKRARESLEYLGFQFTEPVIKDTDRNIEIQFGAKDGYRIELIAPIPNGRKSPIDAYLGNIGPTPYHFCFCTENLEAEIREFEQKRYKVILPPAKAVAFGGKRVAFMANRNVGMIEIVER